ncbi:aromatic alcohol reductase [Aspergillus homomorphus CBS 101889]|uniref:Putative isoflavone reductase family protein CipA n=1 Tax=Aspergillus homomorphus (strain CBS 101889) TaxID=1450537 RepID=A0A395I8W1_ASPHC|nr:putative isoflavone reductase family protein CipA [Aspergillus homomorphus CBS 101889]RAL16219.1 putative isoflavone reductase family protein CipA [Aspergillus homomorphus CBS 101889]
MSRTIKNVALAGASGNVGSHVLSALLELEFNVTVLSRNSSKSFPGAARVQVVDFTSTESLSAAFANQDAVIDTTFSPDTEAPLRLIDAAVQAGVYRFDFGLDPNHPEVHNLPVFARKKAAYDSVKRHAHATQPPSLTYTLIANGIFLDWSLSSGFAGFDLCNKKATLFGDGTNIVPWTALEDVGRATARVLLRPEETVNRVVYVHSAYLSQRELLGVAKGVLGEEGWGVVAWEDMRVRFDAALADLRAGRISDAVFEVQIRYCIADSALVGPWPRDDNALLGVKEWDLGMVGGLVGRIAGVDA